MTLLSPRREVGEFKKRYKWMVLVVLLTFLVLIGRMVQLQLVQHEKWAARAQENITKEITLPATRGIIRDADGRVVAANRPSFSVYVTPQLLDPDRDIDRIAELMALSPEERAAFEARLAEIPSRRRTHQIEMFTDISRDQLAALETHSNDLPGIDVVAVPRRTYPFERLAAHAIGYLNEVNGEDLEAEAREEYRPGDQIGRSGLERAWESYLRGQRGELIVPVDAQGRVQSGGPGSESRVVRREPVPGRDLTLTLDMELMRAIERAFRGHPSGAAVVVDVEGGRVRALFSKPSYDLNEMSGRLTQARFDELRTNPFRPLIDKTVYETYFPGSTFKPFSALAALEDGSMDRSVRVDCPGYYELGNRKFRCTHAHGEVGIHGALVQSCNVYFYRLAEQVGLDRLAHYAREFGFGQPTGLGINTENGGFVASRQWYIDRYGKPYRLGFTLNTAIGQGNTRTTLLQMGMAYAALANGGKLYAPQLVKRLEAPDGEVIEEFTPRLRREVEVEAEHMQLVLDGLYGVVHNRDGTAHAALIKGGVPVAGKTGTAEVAKRLRKGQDPKRAWYYRRDHAWFVGLAPRTDPEIVVVVLVEHGGAGGKTAAPIAMEIVQEYLGGEEEAQAKRRRSGDATYAARGER